MIPPKTQTGRPKAFTLIELLVVIAIISLLVSILLPSLRQAKLLAQQVQCMTILRNMGTSSAMGMEEQGGIMIGIREKHKTNKGTIDVFWMMNNLLRVGMNLPEAAWFTSDPLYDQRYYVPPEAVCPLSYAYANPRPDFGGTCKWHDSYGWNGTHIEAVYTWDTSVPWITEFEKIEHPSNKSQIADGINPVLRKDRSDRYFEEIPSSSAVPAYRHDGRINIEYFDGHVDTRLDVDVIGSDEIWDAYGEDYKFED
ncbi:MAG: type II secretion system protein [Phycisphaerae bacterium]|nr:type II secretion system protein [Phycisphaerae bacterium]